MSKRLIKNLTFHKWCLTCWVQNQNVKFLKISCGSTQYRDMLAVKVAVGYQVRITTTGRIDLPVMIQEYIRTDRHITTEWCA